MNERMLSFESRLRKDVLRHPVITANPYTTWFRRGEFSPREARAFLVQFSVFSNQFLVAQLHKVLNAETLAEMRASKEILANEIGVGYRRASRTPEDAELGGIYGSIEGGTFHFRAAHFELLVRTARQFGLEFSELGRRRFGTAATLQFCDELLRLYGSEDYAVSAAASWAVENWAAAGFWDELVEGWLRYGKRIGNERLDIAFFTWHARVEANHARHTSDELAAFYAQREVDEDAFVRCANEMLNGVYTFWRGLDEQRNAIAAETRAEGRHAEAC